MDRYSDSLYIINNDSTSHTIHVMVSAKHARMYNRYVTVCPHSREKTQMQIGFLYPTKIEMDGQSKNVTINATRGRPGKSYIIITSSGKLTFQSP